jgi:hypothetical protein
LNKLHVSPAAFLAVFCCIYVFVFVENWPLFLYYPLHGDFYWGHQIRHGIGPAMAWYGLMADAGIAALVVSICVPARFFVSLFRNYMVICPIAAMVVVAFLLRHLFF